MSVRTIYKLLTREEWEAAQGAGVYRGSARDLRDGFIHFSTAAQLRETARKYFTNVPDLVLLAASVEALTMLLTPHPAALPPPSPARGEGTLPISGVSPLPSRERGRGEGEEQSALRWEPSRGGDLFPHLYIPLPLSAVKRVTAIPLGEDGTPIIPGDLAP
jgi:uncharacterized protein (DUF952 family)